MEKTKLNLTNFVGKLKKLISNFENHISGKKYLFRKLNNLENYNYVNFLTFVKSLLTNKGASRTDFISIKKYKQFIDVKIELVKILILTSLMSIKHD